jgi:hypothetical protein
MKNLVDELESKIENYSIGLHNNDDRRKPPPPRRGLRKGISTNETDLKRDEKAINLKKNASANAAQGSKTVVKKKKVKKNIQKIYFLNF